MKKYTIISELGITGKIEVQQVDAANPFEAMRVFADKKQDWEEDIDKDNLSHIRRVTKAWCYDYLFCGKFYIANIIETSKLQSGRFFVIAIYFRGGTYLYRLSFSDFEPAIHHWATHLSCRYYCKEDRDVIRKKILADDYQAVTLEGVNILEIKFYVNRRLLKMIVIRTP